MPIELTVHESHNGMSELICVEVMDFADTKEAKQVIETAVAILSKIKGAKKHWQSDEDCCFEVTGGLLRKNGGMKALDKVEKELRDVWGYRDEHIIRKQLARGV